MPYKHIYRSTVCSPPAHSGPKFPLTSVLQHKCAVLNILNMSLREQSPTRQLSPCVMAVLLVASVPAQAIATPKKTTKLGRLE